MLNPSYSTEIPSEFKSSKTGGANDENLPKELPVQTGSKPLELVPFHVKVANPSIFPLLLPEKSKFLSPNDSSQFNIPSLSISISILSFTPSKSVSGGHALTGILSESRIPSQSSTAPEI